MSRKYLNYIVFGYIALLILGGFYVNNVLIHQEVKEYKESDEQDIELKPVNVYLKLNDTSYRIKLTNQDTVTDLLDKARDANNIFFERTMYTYGSDIEDVNHITTPEGYKWKILLNNEDITYQADAIKLIDETTYSLELIKEK